MSPTSLSQIEIVEILPEADWAQHLADLTRVGLASDQPWTPPVWFYDELGSGLFDQITRLPEYYPTRTERNILADNVAEILALAGANHIVELGSGTSEKMHILLEAGVEAGALQEFTALDCSRAPLEAAGEAIKANYPSLILRGLVADFNEHLGHARSDLPTMIVFLGSTIGNFHRTERAEFFANLAEHLGPEDSFLIGADLVKSVDRMTAAYNDSKGVTSEFNLNALSVMNAQLDTNFDIGGFVHRAVWNAQESRIEMQLVATRDHATSIQELGVELDLKPGDHIRTEISTKFTPDTISAELAVVGLSTVGQWTDAAGDFQLTLVKR
jgi:L-histidine N-alpha-methyltransferase